MDYFLFDFSGVQFHYTMSHKKFFYDILAQILYGTYNSTWYVLNYLRYYLAFSAF